MFGPAHSASRRAEHFLLTSIVNYSWRVIFWTRPARANDHGKANAIRSALRIRQSHQLVGEMFRRFAAAVATSRLPQPPPASLLQSSIVQSAFIGQGLVRFMNRRQPLLIMCWPVQGRLAANPEKAHTRDAPRTSTASGMPNAMAAHIPRVFHGFGSSLAAAIPRTS